MPGYHHEYLKFYPLPNSNFFTHRLLFFSREATSEAYGPRVFLIILFAFVIYFYLHLFSYLLIQKPKKYFAALYFICDLLFQSITTFSRQLANFWRRYPKGIDNPFNTSGCEVLLFVCRCCLRCVAWFSYWFDNLGFTSEGNTYRRCAASSLPLWGNTDVASSDIKMNFWRRCRGGSSTYTRFLITNLISLQFTLFSICLSFSSPPLHKNLPFYSLLFFRSPFSCRICF